MSAVPQAELVKGDLVSRDSNSLDDVVVVEDHHAEDGTFLQRSLTYWCEGCNNPHTVPVVRPDGKGHVWGWNEDRVKPVLNPSQLHTMGHYVQGQPQPPECGLCNSAAERGRESFCGRCHTFIGTSGAQPGEITFLTDCTHSLRGARPLLRRRDWPGHGRSWAKIAVKA